MTTIVIRDSGPESPGFDSFGAAKDRAWQAIGKLAEGMAAERPSVGKRVTVTGGRKHKGKVGTVFYHRPDAFGHPFRYCNDMQRAMREARGTNGFRVGIETDDGEKFFTAANQVTVTP